VCSYTPLWPPLDCGFGDAGLSVSFSWSPMTVFRGQNEKAGHFLQPTARATGQRVMLCSWCRNSLHPEGSGSSRRRADPGGCRGAMGIAGGAGAYRPAPQPSTMPPSAHTSTDVLPRVTAFQAALRTSTGSSGSRRQDRVRPRQAPHPATVRTRWFARRLPISSVR